MTTVELKPTQPAMSCITAIFVAVIFGPMALLSTYGIFQSSSSMEAGASLGLALLSGLVLLLCYRLASARTPRRLRVDDEAVTLIVGKKSYPTPLAGVDRLFEVQCPGVQDYPSLIVAGKPNTFVVHKAACVPESEYGALVTWLTEKTGKELKGAQNYKVLLECGRTFKLEP